MFNHSISLGFDWTVPFASTFTSLKLIFSFLLPRLPPPFKIISSKYCVLISHTHNASYRSERSVGAPAYFLQSCTHVSVVSSWAHFQVNNRLSCPYLILQMTFPLKSECFNFFLLRNNPTAGFPIHWRGNHHIKLTTYIFIESKESFK